MTRKKTEKKESEHYYYNYLNGRKNSKYMDTLKFVKYIKDLFFNSTTSKWIPSKYKKFINRNSLDYKKCFETLSSLRVNNVFLKQKGYSKFLERIEKYSMFFTPSLCAYKSKQSDVSFTASGIYKSPHKTPFSIKLRNRLIFDIIPVDNIVFEYKNECV